MKETLIRVSRVVQFAHISVAAMFAPASLVAQNVSPDAMRGPALRDVRLEGWLGAKMDRFIERRLVDPFMREQVFDEARQAFEFRDDDVARVGGLWRGEFWGKEMLSSARVAEYLQDKEFLSFIRDECHRLMRFQDADGYLGSYSDKDFIHIRDMEACGKKFGWYPNWNLWNRKYCIWGMFMAYKATGDRSILASVTAQLDNWIETVHRVGVPICDTGTPTIYGLAPMSILKPLLMVYEETGNKKYLDFATEMLPFWDRADGRRPNFFRNITTGKALHTWHPEPERWAKSYEMMSCLDGLLEYYRVTGERRCLDTVAKIRDLLEKYETNPLGGVGFVDKFVCAASRPNGASEVCDAIHWMRLNIDLFLITGEDRYLDSVERCYYNNFFAGVDRDGLFGSFAVRAIGRHDHKIECGYAYSHCCVNNVPRSFMDFASTVVTVDKNGIFHVNQYQDATVTLDGVKFTIRGGYPVEGRVTVSVSDASRKVAFRRPSWCPRMDVTENGGVYTVNFDMNPRLVASAQMVNPQDASTLKVTDGWAENRHSFGIVGGDVRKLYRKSPALALWNGPLLLAKSRRLGMTTDELEDSSTVIGQGYRPVLARIPSDRVMAAWDVRLVKKGAPDIKAKVCDFQSAADARLGNNFTWFSIWF
ncbi:MAG: hypothetical protein E7046_14070 [Lentisphaerae bacterium]|nr:hypothetical protein [Lentisphaerota bacterium]